VQHGISEKSRRSGLSTGARNGHKLVSYLSPVTGRAFPFRFRENGEEQEIRVPHYLGVNESNAHLAAAVAGLIFRRLVTQSSTT
jgi:hypothetical protein